MFHNVTREIEPPQICPDDFLENFGGNKSPREAVKRNENFEKNKNSEDFEKLRF